MSMPSSPTRRVILLPVLLLLVGLSLAACGPKDYDVPEDAPAWPEETVGAWTIVPVQDGGRVKPLSTWARYVLMRLGGRSSCKTPKGTKLGPVEWALDVMFRPETAAHYECFLVETDDVLTAAELDLQALREKTHKKKRDTYSYAELLPARARIIQLGKKHTGTDRKRRTPVQGGLVDLFHGLMEYEGLRDYLAASRKAWAVPADLRDLFDGAEEAPYSTIVTRAPAILKRGNGMGFLKTVAAEAGRTLSVFPPTTEQRAALEDAKEKRLYEDAHPDAWLSSWDLIARPVQAPTIPTSPRHTAMLAELEAMLGAEPTSKAFTAAAVRFQREGADLAGDLGLYDKIDLEVNYYRMAFFHWAFGFFIIGFVLIAFSWIFPKGWLSWSAFGVVAGAALYAAIGITLRSIIRERPPVLTLYDTVLFVTITGVLAVLVVELLSRKRIALAIAPVIGALGMLLAFAYDVENKQDTMGKLMAVLDTNFWLTTHVICISFGYMGSMLTGALGHVYVLGKVFGFRKGSAEPYRTLTSLIYGMLAFGLIFSVVGTILGGIWADESWGRFWGWDPKENGALLIVLWQLGMIHARLGGYIKSWGIAMASVFLTPIVAFSWWHVNHLGIGLHSYGFTQGVLTTLTIFYVIEAVVLLAGATWWLVGRLGQAGAPPGRA